MSEPPVLPKAPELMDFGLNTVMVEQLARDARLKKMADWISSAVCILGIALMWTAAQEGHFPVRVAVPSALGLMATVVLLYKVPEFCAKRNLLRAGADPTRVEVYYEATREYQAQLKEYEKAKREFDEWFGRSQRAFWLSLSPNQFEHEVGRLYRRLGYSAVVTKQSRDGGADVILSAGHGTTIVQCKAHQRKIGVKSFRELYGVMGEFGAESAILVCLHGATDDARRFILGKPIRVVMLNDLVQMSRDLADDVGGDGSA